MADLIYLRHSADTQHYARQLRALAPYLEAGARCWEDPAASFRIHPLARPGVTGLLEAASAGDTVRVADATRLFRGVRDVLDVREALHRRGLRLRIATGAWSGLDLAADDSTAQLCVTMLEGVLEVERGIASEGTREGVAAAVARGGRLGRPAALSDGQAADVVRQYRDGAAVKALAREYGVAAATIRRVLDAAGARDDR